MSHNNIVRSCISMHFIILRFTFFSYTGIHVTDGHSITFESGEQGRQRKVNEILENYNFSKRRGVRIVPTANFLSISICSLKSRKVGGPTSYTFFICKFKRNVCCKEPPPEQVSKVSIYIEIKALKTSLLPVKEKVVTFPFKWFG